MKTPMIDQTPATSMASLLVLVGLLSLLVVPNSQASSTSNTFDSLNRLIQSDYLENDGFTGIRYTYEYDDVGNMTAARTLILPLVDAGDFNYDQHIDLKDLILVIKLVSGQSYSRTFILRADPDGDGKVTLADGVYIMKKVSE